MEDPVVPLERNLYGHPLAGLLWERQFEKILLKHGWEKVSNWECLFVHREKALFLSVYVDDIKLAGKKHNIDPMWKVLNKEVDLGEPTSFLDGQRDGVPKAGPEQAAADSPVSRTCVVCKHLSRRVAHAGEQGRINVLPWYRLVGVAKTSCETQGGKNSAARKGEWSPRGMGMTVLTYPVMRPGNRQGW